MVTDIDLARSETLAEALGENAMAAELDVQDEAAWATVLSEVVARYGQLDVLVNNAGGGGAGNVEETSFDDFRSALKLNLDSVFIGCPPLCSARVRYSL